MTETQIYKWWWDQTRKRVKRLKITRARLEAQNCNRTASKEATAQGPQNSDEPSAVS